MSVVRGLGEEIKDLYLDDQKDREEKLYDRDMELFLHREQKRLSRAKEILLSIDQLTGESLCDLAMIFQHGADSDDFKTAHNLAMRAVETGYDDARWLAAAAEDRYLLSKGEKQIWGTQFGKDDTGEWVHQPFASDAESGITDEKRNEMHVPIRSDQLDDFRKKYGIHD